MIRVVKDSPVLIADDVKLYREMLRRWVIEAEMTPLVADDGVEALRLFGDHQPPIVITDIEMAGGDGYELIQGVRAADWRSNRHTRVIVMSSLRDSDIGPISANQGADAFIEKPIVKSALMRLLDLSRPLKDWTDLSDRSRVEENESIRTVSPVLRRIVGSAAT